MKRILILMVIAASATAGEVPCPAPLVVHDDTTVYVTHRTGLDYTIRIQAPDADPGELLSMTIKIGSVAQLTIPTPAPLSCHEEDVSLVEGRHEITRWATTAAGDTDKPSTQGKFRVPGPRLW